MAYEVPGRAERVSPELAALWNAEILRAYEARESLHSRFFAIDPAGLDGARVSDAVTWPADPLEPSFCADRRTVRALCDSGHRGRQAFHNEYCEYAVVYGRDGRGRTRPKRVQVTTELREYWLTLATHDPRQLRSAATDVLGREPAWEELYGVDGAEALAPGERRLRFTTTTAGHGDDVELKAVGVPRDPRGRLNRENALFMSHPINGLDDLLFVLLFGARHYVVRERGGGPRRAERDDVLARSPELACRHADPAVALAAYRTVLESRAIAFADPLGVYLRPFNWRLLELDGEPIPAAWVRWSRGEAGMFQRLVVGPGDEEDAFLDDIELSVGQERQRLAGGHQLLRMLEVGPLLATGATDPAGADEREEIAAGGPIECLGAEACEEASRLAGEGALADEARPPLAAGA